MTAMTTLPFRPDGWTVEDLDDLPDDGYRYEIVDGSLLVTPPPELIHQYVASRLVVLLSPQLPEPLRAVAAPGIYVDGRNYRIPDVVVFPHGPLRGRRLAPSDVVLAIEIVSPGSVRTDRVDKPGRYAAAGMPHLWRVELDPLEVVVHVLRDGEYVETGRHAEALAVTQPVPLRLDVQELLI